MRHTRKHGACINKPKYISFDIETTKFKSSWCHGMPTYPSLQLQMTSPEGNIFRVHQWIPLKKASDAELWYFLWSAPEQTLEQTIETRVIWDAIALIMTSLYGDSLFCREAWRDNCVLYVSVMWEIITAMYRLIISYWELCMCYEADTHQQRRIYHALRNLS